MRSRSTTIKPQIAHASAEKRIKLEKEGASERERQREQVGWLHRSQELLEMSAGAWPCALTAWPCTWHQAHFSSLSDVPTASGDNIRCKGGRGLFHFLPNLLNRLWLLKYSIVVSTTLLNNLLNMGPIPIIKGVQIRGARRPVNATLETVFSPI